MAKHLVLMWIRAYFRKNMTKFAFLLILLHLPSTASEDHVGDPALVPPSPAERKRVEELLNSESARYLLREPERFRFDPNSFKMSEYDWSIQSEFGSMYNDHQSYANNFILDRDEKVALFDYLRGNQHKPLRKVTATVRFADHPNETTIEGYALNTHDLDELKRMAGDQFREKIPTTLRGILDLLAEFKLIFRKEIEENEKECAHGVNLVVAPKESCTFAFTKLFDLTYHGSSTYLRFVVTLSQHNKINVYFESTEGILERYNLEKIWNGKSYIDRKKLADALDTLNDLPFTDYESSSLLRYLASVREGKTLEREMFLFLVHSAIEERPTASYRENTMERRNFKQFQILPPSNYSPKNLRFELKNKAPIYRTTGSSQNTRETTGMGLNTPPEAGGLASLAERLDREEDFAFTTLQLEAAANFDNVAARIEMATLVSACADNASSEDEPVSSNEDKNETMASSRLCQVRVTKKIATSTRFKDMRWSKLLDQHKNIKILFGNDDTDAADSDRPKSSRTDDNNRKPHGEDGSVGSTRRNQMTEIEIRINPKSAKKSSALRRATKWASRTMHKAEKWANKHMNRLNYGLAALGIFGAVAEFQNGNTEAGALTIGMSGFQMKNLLREKAMMKAVNKLPSRIRKPLQKGFGKIYKGISKFKSSAVEASTISTKFFSKALASGIGIGFDLYILFDDITRLDRGVRGEETGVSKHVLEVNLQLTMIGYFLGFLAMNPATAGPAAIALVLVTYVRLIYEGYYEWEQFIDKTNFCPENHLGEELCDFVDSTLAFGAATIDFFSGGYLSQVKAGYEQEAEDMATIASFRNISEYAKIHGDCESGHSTIDFTSGGLSENAGEIVFRMEDNGFYEYEGEIPVFGARSERKSYSAVCKTLKDVVLGVGQALGVNYRRNFARWWGIDVGNAYRSNKKEEFISSRSEDRTEEALVSSPDWSFFPSTFNGLRYVTPSFVHIMDMDGVWSSRSGVYHGNNKDNVFHFLLAKETGEYTECPELDPNAESYHLLTSYKYELYGRDGNDVFLVGPQTSVIYGGNGRDQFIIQPTSGNTTIDITATDGIPDFLYLNVSLDHMSGGKDELDLIIRFCMEGLVTVRNWFNLETREQRLIIRTKDDFFIHPNTEVGDERKITLQPYKADFTERKDDIELDMDKEPSYNNFTRVFGSRYANNMIYGNDRPNTLVAGEKSNFFEGRGGSDLYIINRAAKVRISNCDFVSDPQDDILMLNKTFKEIKVSRNGIHVHMTFDQDPMKIMILNWLSNSSCQHLYIQTQDSTTSTLRIDSEGKLIKLPLKLDYSLEESYVTVNLEEGIAPEYPNGTDLSGVTVINSSPFADTLIGDDHYNVFTCNGSGVKMAGRDDYDIYTIAENCQVPVIDACGFDDQQDNIFFARAQFFDLEICDEIMNPLDESGSSLDSDIYIAWKDVNSKVTPECNRKSGKLLRVLEAKADSQCRPMISTMDGFLVKLREENSPSAQSRYSAMVINFGLRDRNHFLCCSIDMEYFELNSRKIFTDTYSVSINVPTKNSSVKGNARGNQFNSYRKNRGLSAYLEGRNGSDTYTIDRGSQNTVINNYAEDEEVDSIELKVEYSQIIVSPPNSDKSVLVAEKLDPNETRVVLLNFWKGEKYQHLSLKSIDGIRFVITKTYPYKRGLSVDKRDSKKNEMIQMLDDDASLSSLLYMKGSDQFPNKIFGAKSTEWLVGGNSNDFVSGTAKNERIEGKDGNDTLRGGYGSDVVLGGLGADAIYGGFGNDHLYGGEGPDFIDGGPGVDTVFFEGRIDEALLDNRTKLEGAQTYYGVRVNLTEGLGHDGDAEGDVYHDVENVMGTGFNDTLEDDDGDNFLDGGYADDILIVNGGVDILQGGHGKDVYDLRKASGVKMIRNEDVSSDPEEDWLKMKHPVKEADTLTPLKSLYECAFEYLSDLVVAWHYGPLITVFKDYRLGPSHQHIVIVTAEKIYQGEKLIPMVSYQQKMVPWLSINLVTKQRIEFSVSCRNCPATYHLVYTEVRNNSKPKWMEIKSSLGEDRAVDGLKSGTKYSFVVVVMICGHLVEQSKEKAAITNPDEIKSLTIEEWRLSPNRRGLWRQLHHKDLDGIDLVIEEYTNTNYLRFSWNRVENIASDDEHGYDVHITRKVGSSEQETIIAKHVKQPQIVIPSTPMEKQTEIKIRVRAVSYGTPGEWSKTQQLRINSCSKDECPDTTISNTFCR